MTKQTDESLLAPQTVTIHNASVLYPDSILVDFSDGTTAVFSLEQLLSFGTGNRLQVDGRSSEVGGLRSQSGSRRSDPIRTRKS